jgi:hypothetical protein
MATMQGELSDNPRRITTQTLSRPDRTPLPWCLFLRTLCGECKLIAVNLQISAFPLPKSIIHLADAAAIKVRYSMSTSIWLGAFDLDS